MPEFKRVAVVEIDVGGEPHQGWLPPGAAEPPPTPRRKLTLDLTIEGDTEGGYSLIQEAREDPSHAYDDWFVDLAGALQSAESRFGVAPNAWEEVR